MFQQLSRQKNNFSKDSDWYDIRKSMLNKWMCKPDWCCLQIRRFLGYTKSASNIRLKLVSEYLSCSGFRTGAINYQCVIKLKSDIFNEIKNRKTKNNWS